MSFNVNETIADVTSRVLSGSNEGLYKIDILDEEGISYSGSTPMKYLVDKEFIIRTNGKNYNSILNFDDVDESLVTIFDQNHSLKNEAGYKICEQMDLNDREQKVIGGFLNKVVAHAKGQKNMSKGKLKMILENQFLDQALKNKKTILNYEQQIDLLQDKLEGFKDQKVKISAIIKKSTSRRMKMVTGFYLM